MAGQQRGRKPKHPNLKVLEGNPGKRKINTDIPQAPNDLPEPPPELCADALAEWHRMLPGLAAMGVLSSVDRGVFSAYCQAWGRWVSAERTLRAMAEKDQVTKGLLIKTSNGNFIQNPLVGIANKSASDYVRFAAELGLSPSARSRINMNPGGPPTGSKFDGMWGGD